MKNSSIEDIRFNEESFQTPEFSVMKDSISFFFIETTKCQYAKTPSFPTKPSLPNFEPIFLSSLGCGVFYIAAQLNRFTVAPNIFFYLSVAISFFFLLLAIYFIWSKDRKYEKSLVEYQVKLKDHEKIENSKMVDVFNHEFFLTLVSGRQLGIFSLESNEETTPKELVTFSEKFKAWLEN
jgi:hypothetical protein